MAAATLVYVALPAFYIANARPRLDRPFEYGAPEANWQKVMLAAAEWSNEHLQLSKTDRILSFNSGLLSWTSNGTVINIDGLANEDWRRFRASGGSVAGYCARVGARYYIDGADPAGLFSRYQVRHVIPFGHPTLPSYYVVEVQCP